MRTFVVTPPAPVVSWEEAAQHLKLEADDEEQRAEVEAFVAAATAYIDGPTGWLGRSIGAQTLECRIDNFDAGSVRLRYPPQIDVVAVKYIDSAGVEQTVPGGAYELQGDALVPSFGTSWPSPRLQREAVRIQYRAGHRVGAEPAAAAPLPATIRAAILLMTEHLYRNRSPVSESMTTTVENLLAPLRRWY